MPRLGSACPHSGIAPWTRREGPSMAQRSYPGRAPISPVGAKLAREAALQPTCFSLVSPIPCGNGLAREGAGAYNLN
ncbi:hypothetical protein EMIT043CA1_30397 [Pseudomonas brassicacearum]